MPSRVDARDVLDANARTTRAFSGQIVGHYRPSGPNSWDDYLFVSADAGQIEVLPGLKVQFERHGARFRMRREGRVIRVEWRPTNDDLKRLRRDDSRARRELFLSRHLELFDEAEGQAVAVLASKLLD